ncbi:MAG TPA: GDP-mannose 4,6-dehydratase [Candidatus Thermoplasmatota archaeon]|nr:GDP-mannose 4,6-dehydratase [Candidatus Thermoplasmatota archaeon]
MTILITGGTGFIGCHLARALLAEGHDVTIAGYSGQAKPPWPWTPEMDARRVQLDVRDKAAVERVVARVRPEEVYHLAAQSLPALSWKIPEETMLTNALGTIHLFEAFRALGLKPRTFVACSSAEYGLVPPQETPVKEERILRPVHPYGVSKVAQDLLAAQYALNDGIPAIRGRIFNTTGPGKSQDAPGDFAERVVAAERAGGGVLRVGNLTPRRDLSDVRDQVRAIVGITRKGRAGEAYNVSSGRTVVMQDVAEAFTRHARAPVRIEVDPSLFRPTDEPVIWGDSAKLRAVVGDWARVPLEKTVDDMLRQVRGEDVDL